jgi:hypothetical protein
VTGSFVGSTARADQCQQQIHQISEVRQSGMTTSFESVAVIRLARNRNPLGREASSLMVVAWHDMTFFRQRNTPAESMWRNHDPRDEIQADLKSSEK